MERFIGRAVEVIYKDGNEYSMLKNAVCVSITHDFIVFNSDKKGNIAINRSVISKIQEGRGGGDK